MTFLEILLLLSGGEMGLILSKMMNLTEAQKSIPLCSSLPIAFKGLGVASLYDLVHDLANTCGLYHP